MALDERKLFFRLCGIFASVLTTNKTRQKNNHPELTTHLCSP